MVHMLMHQTYNATRKMYPHQIRSPPSTGFAVGPFPRSESYKRVAIQRLKGGGREIAVFAYEQQQGEEEDDGASMVRIDSESRSGITGEGAFGPLAVLLVGFLQEDLDSFLELMVEMEAQEVKVVPCSKLLLKGTLQDAVEVETVPEHEPPALGLRRTMFLSGMYGSEIVEVVSAYKQSGLPACVFAAAVPNNFGRTVEGLVKEVHADHEAMAKQRRD